MQFLGVTVMLYPMWDITVLGDDDRDTAANCGERAWVLAGFPICRPVVNGRPKINTKYSVADSLSTRIEHWCRDLASHANPKYHRCFPRQVIGVLDRTPRALLRGQFNNQFGKEASVFTYALQPRDV